MENNFMGKPGQTIPEMTDEKINMISERYIELYEQITGQRFIPKACTEKEIYKKILTSLEKPKN
jgi:phosphoribosylaminoimidazole-succinocarboxamide synthase